MFVNGAVPRGVYGAAFFFRAWVNNVVSGGRWRGWLGVRHLSGWGAGGVERPAAHLTRWLQ